MNKQQIIEKYTRSQGSWGITKDFIIIDDIPKMLEELDRLEQQPEVSEGEIYGKLNTERIATYTKLAELYKVDIGVIRDVFCKGAEWLQSHHPQPNHQDFRNLVDIIWNYVTESTEVPATSTADKLIGQWLRMTVIGPQPISEERIEEVCKKAMDEKYPEEATSDDALWNTIHKESIEDCIYAVKAALTELNKD